MNYRMENWTEELENLRKAVNGKIDGYTIEIAAHYIVDRLENDQYPNRTFTRADIAVAIFNGSIIEGYSSEQNRKRTSRVSDLVTPSRVILGKDMSGRWVIIVVGMLASKHFRVITCFPPGLRYLDKIKAMEGKNS